MHLTDQAINDQASVAQLLGISAGSGRLAGYEGQTLPASTYAGRDHAAVPWSLDSPLFWGGVIAVLTFAGIIGASGSLRVGRARVSAEV